MNFSLYGIHCRWEYVDSISACWELNSDEPCVVNRSIAVISLGLCRKMSNTSQRHHLAVEQVYDGSYAI